MANHIVVLRFVVLSFSYLVHASDDPAVLQDICLTDTPNSFEVNGIPCKIATPVDDNEFSFSSLHLVGNTSNQQAYASDPASLQDFCVADTTSTVKVNGIACKNSSLVNANDFFYSGLHLPGNTSNKQGSTRTPVFTAQIPGLNTQAIALVRLDYAPLGLNPPHIHPRATEILTVLEGSLAVGFVTSNPDNRIISKVLQKGDVFVFPVGLVHYEMNVGNCTNAVALSAFGSQNPGVINIANSVFGASPPIPRDILAKAFQLDTKVVDYLQATTF